MEIQKNMNSQNNVDQKQQCYKYYNTLFSNYTTESKLLPEYSIGIKKKTDMYANRIYRGPKNKPI